MDKSVLNDYIDACAFIEETEAEIKRLEQKRRIIQDRVKGSNPDFPYEARSFNLGGTIETMEESTSIAREKQLLAVQKDNAVELKLQVEEWMQMIPFRMKRIITYKHFNRLSWEEVATLMKCKGGGEAVRLEFYRFMKNK